MFEVCSNYPNRLHYSVDSPVPELILRYISSVSPNNTGFEFGISFLRSNTHYIGFDSEFDCSCFANYLHISLLESKEKETVPDKINIKHDETLKLFVLLLTCAELSLPILERASGQIMNQTREVISRSKLHLLLNSIDYKSLESN